LSVLFVCYFVAIVLTYLAFPLWTWVEATFGIESVGRETPAGWPLALVYVACLAVAVLVLVRSSRRSSSERPTVVRPRP
jgi:TRAP-type C4-dicarboxylate transport system permease small subunit